MLVHVGIMYIVQIFRIIIQCFQLWDIIILVWACESPGIVGFNFSMLGINMGVEKGVGSSGACGL